MPDSAPDWLARAQAVCFGMTPSGLPDTSGWIVLILSPLLLLSALYVAYADDLFYNLQIVSRSPIGRTLLFALLCALVTESVWVSAQIRQGRNAQFVPSLALGALPVNYPKTVSHAPDFLLIDQHGSEISLAHFRGRPIILTFVYAHCQTVCPSLVHTVKGGRDLTVAQQSAALMITLDPLRDTPASLPTLAKKWELGAEEHVLSGDPKDVDAVIRSFNVPTSRDDTNGDITHPAIVFILDGNGDLAYSFNNPSPEWIMEAIKRL